MKKRSLRLLSLLLAILMIAGMLEAPLGLSMVNAVDDVPTPSIPDATEYYLNNDFETIKNGAVDISGINLLPRHEDNVIEVRNDDSYIYLEKNTEQNPRIYRDLSDVINASCVVVELAMATTKLSGAALNLTGTAAEGAEARTLPFVSVDAAGKIYANGKDTGKSIAANGVFVTATVAINSDDNTYSLWLDGEQILNGETIAETAFGKLSAMSVELCGSVTDAANLKIDNLKVYGYNYTAAVYSDNDFSENADGFTFKTLTGSAVNNSQLKAEEGYLYLNSKSNNGAVAYWNKGEGNNGVQMLSKQFVVSFDHTAFGSWGNWRLYLVDEAGKTIEVLWNNGNGGLKRYYLDASGNKAKFEGSIPASSDEKTNWRNITLVFDMEAMTYSYYGLNYNGNQESNNLDMKLANVNGDFGTVQYLRFDVRGDDGQNLCLDNFKVYEGTEIAAPAAVSDETGSIPEADIVYIENTFDTNDQSELEFFAGSSSNKADVVEGNRYVYLEKNASASGTDVQIYKSFGDTITSDYVVVSADIASANYQSARFYFNGGNLGPNIRTGNKVFWESSDILNDGNRIALEDDGGFVNVTVVIDSAAGTYHFWLDGEMVKNGQWTAGRLSTLKISLNTAGEHLMVDNLKVYSYAEVQEETVPSTTAPTEPEYDPSVKVYYNNDFSENASGFTFAALKGNAINYSKHDADNDYLYLRSHSNNNPVAWWNKGDDGKAAMPLEDKFVVCFDHMAMDKWANWRLYLVDEEGDKIEVLWNSGNGGLKRYYLDATGTKVNVENSVAVSTTDGNKVYPVALVFDMTTKTYSYYGLAYNATEKVENLNLKLADTTGNFGKVQYLEFLARGDDGQNANLIIDNMKVYAGAEVLENVGPQNQFPEGYVPEEPQPTDPTPTDPTPTEPTPSEPGDEPGGDVKVYYNNDFSANADGIDFAAMGGTSANYSKYDAEGKYLYLRCHNNNNPVALWNKGEGGKGAVELPDSFVVSFDHAAMSKWANWSLYLVDEDGTRIRILWNMGNGALKRFLMDDTGTSVTKEHSMPVSNADEMKWRNISLAFNMTTKTYSYWCEDWSKSQVIEALDLKLPDADGAFGKVAYIELYARGDDKDTDRGNLLIDNLKIYEGTKVLQNVGPQNQFPPKPEPEGDKVWYNNDFNTNADGITFIDTVSKHVLEGNEGHLYLRGIGDTKIFYWNRGTNGKPRAPLTNKFVISFEVSSLALSDGGIKLVDEKGETIQVMLFSQKDNYLKVYRTYEKEGAWTTGISNIGYNYTDGRTHKIDIAINTETGKFSVWKDGALVLESLYLCDNDFSFGTVQFISFNANDTTVGTKDDGIEQHLKIDNLKIYEGTKPRADVGEVTEIPTLPEDGNGFFKPEGVETGNGRYYESDLENKSTSELTLIGGTEITQEANGNHSISMPVGSWFSWNYLQKWEPSEYVVYEVTVKQNYAGTLLFRVSSQEGNSFYPIKFRKTGEITPSHVATSDKLMKGQEVRVAVAINAVDNTYSVWYDGVLVLENAKISSTHFGALQGFRFDVSDGELAKTEWRVDNIRIYQGLCPEDYSNTVQLTEQPRDESWLDEVMGTESELLDYATEEKSIIDAAGAVLVNTETLYIYQNGKKTQGTKAQVDALVKNTAGKTVIKNGLGLVIISPKALELTEEQIESLHTFMVFTRPTAAAIKAAFKSTSSQHPRIILTPDKLAQLRADYKTNDRVKEWVDQVINSSDLRLKSRHVEFSDESFTRSFRDNWTKLSLAYLFTGDAKYKDYLWEDILGATKFPNWKYNDGLANGDASFGIAIAYDWLYDAWTPAQRKVLEEAIYDQVLYYAHRNVYGKGSGTGTYWASDTNRNAVSNGGRGMAMLAVFDVYPDKIADILEKTYHLLEIMMVEFAPDGANLEGPAYWDYQMHYLVPFLQSSINTLGTDFNIMDAPGFNRTLDFYMDVDGMTGVNNFHDATADDHGVLGAALGLADMLGRPDLSRAMVAKMDVYNTDEGMWSLIYFNSRIKYDGTVDKDLDAYYKGLELVSMRSSWLNSAGIYVSAHSGENGISHSHLDAGAFVLDIGGQRFASDYGKESYNLAGSSNVNFQYYYFRRRAEGHNVFVINPDLVEGKDLGQATYSSDVVSKFVTKSRGAYAIMPLDGAYKGYAQSAARGIMLGDDRKSVLIRDEIRGMNQDTNEIYWFMQMENVETKISADGKSAILSKGGVDVHMQVLSNATDWQIKILPAKEMVPLAGLPDVDKQTPNTNFTRLAIVFKAGKDVNINVKFAEVDDPKGDTPIKDTALANWTIPDGVLVPDPTVYGIEIGGREIPNFSKNQTFYNFELPYGTEECPDVKVIGGEGCDITIKKPKKLPGYLNITVANKADSKSQTKYKIHLTVSGPISVEVSDTPQAANHAKNMLDGNLGTRWAVSGAGWAKFTFPSPQKVDSVWLASWEQTMRVQPFDIEVSEDGVNFKQVWKGTTTMLPEGSKDQLQEFKIPEGTYKAIRMNFTGAQYPDGHEYSWTSVLEVMFYYQGKPIEIILQTSDPDKEFTDNPNDTVEDDKGNNKDPENNAPTGPADPDASVPVDDDNASNNVSNASSGSIWLIVGLCVAAVAVAGAIVFVVLKKKKAAAAGESAETEVQETSAE